MGNLVKTPHSEVTASLEVLERFGVRPEHLDRMRADMDRAKMVAEALISDAAMLKTTRLWHEQDGVIYFSVTSDGTTGLRWISRLVNKGYMVSDHAKNVLRHKDFKPTKAGTIHEIGVLKGELFSDRERTTKNIRLKAVKNKMILPEAEVACLIREKFSDKDLEAMGLSWIAVMHEPNEDYCGFQRLFSVGHVSGNRWLCAGWNDPGYEWSRYYGFAFAVSQACPPKL